MKDKILNLLRNNRIGIDKASFLTEELLTMIGFHGKSKWINVEDKLPEDFDQLLLKPFDVLSPLKTEKVLCLTEDGDITDNQRIKMQVGNNNWVWLINYDNSKVVKWTIIRDYPSPSN